jgi:hypothetical protein
VWEGSLGLDFFEEVVNEFPVERKREFTNENLLRGYDNRREDWSKYMLGENY